MAQTTNTSTAGTEVTGWDESVYDEPGEGPKLTRATVRKTFHGAIEGASVAELLTARGTGGSGYVASERFAGTIAGRHGTVVFQHGGLDDGLPAPSDRSSRDRGPRSSLD